MCDVSYVCSSVMISDPLNLKFTFKKCHMLSMEKVWGVIPLILYPKESKGPYNFLPDRQQEELSLHLWRDRRMSHLDT